MKLAEDNRFHKLYGIKRPRIFYQSKDFLDYTLMTMISALIVYLSYGPDHHVSQMGIVLSAFMIFSFIKRHGLALRIPVILKRPQDVMYMIIYKVQNMKPMYVLAIGVLLLENYLIYVTPDLPHETELMREVAIYLFYLHFIGISVYRTTSLIAHLRKQGLVREFLSQTAWRGLIAKQQNMVLEIVHAYLTGILTHIILIAPWFLVITYSSFSILFFPVVILINVITHLAYIRTYNAWFYRDHWLGHNSEMDFLYLHGTHHDAIPSGLIGVSGNGFLEGFTRHTLGHPTPFYNPLTAFILYTLEVQQDIRNHQYIPGIFPKLSRRFHETCQHSTHHFGKLEPYSVAIRSENRDSAEKAKKGFKVFPDEITNSIELDERLTGFKWDNRRYQRFLDLFDRYQG